MTAIHISYDHPFEVTEKQYRHIMAHFRERVAGQEDGGRFYIKVWAMRCAGQIRKVLNDPMLK